MTVRLGILSAARIADVIASASRVVDEVGVVAVASRTASKATAFASRHGVERTCTYDELLSLPEVDAVYVPLPTGLAADWAVRAIAAGKHVLVDKPFASAHDAQRIADAAAQANLVFMDGTHFVHAARTEKAREDVLRKCGELTLVRASFSAPLDLAADIRTDTKLEPHGALGDLGWYCARAAVDFLGTERTAQIKRVACFGSAEPSGMVREASGVVEFSGGQKLVMDCGFDSVLRMRVEVVGTKGCIVIDDFVIPYEQFENPGVAKEEKVTTEYKMEVGKWVDTPLGTNFPNPSIINVHEVDEGKHAVQPARMLKEFARIITQRDMDAARKCAAESVNTQCIVDGLYTDLMTRIAGEIGKK